MIAPEKKHLTEKLSPLAVVNMLKQKHQSEIEIVFEDAETIANNKSGMTKEWTSSISIAEYPGGLKVSAKEPSK